MKFDDLDARMRVYEMSQDQIIPADVFPVIRLDGRGFTRLTKEILTLETPFDARLSDFLAATVEHVMDCGLHILYGYAQSDEISLLVDPGETAFGRKVRKYNSILAGEASAQLSLLVGRVACFDSRVCQLPSLDLVVDYFRWRQEDARRNALSSYCYWEQRRRGVSVAQATKRLKGLSIAEKHALLAEYGIDFERAPDWQKNGLGVYWETFEKQGRDPRTQQAVSALRRRLIRNAELPTGEEYSRFVRSFLIPPDSVNIGAAGPVICRVRRGIAR